MTGRHVRPMSHNIVPHHIACQLTYFEIVLRRPRDRRALAMPIEWEMNEGVHDAKTALLVFCGSANPSVLGI